MVAFSAILSTFFELILQLLSRRLLSTGVTKKGTSFIVKAFDFMTS